MKLISHRGLLTGPNKNLENSPNQILQALNLGYDCEIDVWLIDYQLYLGHDGPTHHIGSGFLERSGLWIHAKNINALHWLTTTTLNYFWHQEDNFTLTSHSYIWTYPGKELTTKSVMVLPEWDDPKFQSLNFNCYGICSDYVLELSKLIN